MATKVIENNDQQHWSFYGIATDGPDFEQMGFFRNYLKFNDNNKCNDNKSKDNSNVGIFRIMHQINLIFKSCIEITC